MLYVAYIANHNKKLNVYGKFLYFNSTLKLCILFANWIQIHQWICSFIRILIHFRMACNPDDLGLWYI